MEQQVADYTLTLQESDDSEQITGSEISLEYVPEMKLKSWQRSRTSFFWITSLWRSR